MIHLKSREELETMEEGGRRLIKVVNELIPTIKVGISTNAIDKRAEELIRQNGGEASFKRVKGYRWSTCLCINDQIVHTPPSARILKSGEILTVDIGMFYGGLHTDYADTIVIGETNEENEKFLQTGKRALEQALLVVKEGNRIGEISKTIQSSVEGSGYSIVNELTGHGLGRELHEEPTLPGYINVPIENTKLIKRGLTIAVEVIYAMGKRAMQQETGSEWSIVTKDHSLSACFEKSIAIDQDGKAVILT